MSDNEIQILLNQILKNGDVKIYSNEGKLINLISDADKAKEIEEYNSYIRSVEKDFRENADTILKGLELSHLHVNTLKEK